MCVVVKLTIQVGPYVSEARLASAQRVVHAPKNDEFHVECDPVHIQRFPFNLLLSY